MSAMTLVTNCDTETTVVICIQKVLHSRVLGLCHTPDIVSAYPSTSDRASEPSQCCNNLNLDGKSPNVNP